MGNILLLFALIWLAVQLYIFSVLLLIHDRSSVNGQSKIFAHFSTGIYIFCFSSVRIVHTLKIQTSSSVFCFFVTVNLDKNTSFYKGWIHRSLQNKLNMSSSLMYAAVVWWPKLFTCQERFLVLFASFI